MSPPLIEANGLALVRNGKRILDDVSFTLSAGKILAIVGESGSGKTMLLRLLAGLERPSEGRLRIAGIAAERLTENRWRLLRQRMGIMLEDGSLLHDLTLAENLAFALIKQGLAPEQLYARLEHALVSFGLDQRCNAQASELSASVSKLAQLARALIIEPNLLLCDAPFDGLDGPTREDLTADLGRRVSAQRITLLITSRDRSYAAGLRADVMELERGRLLPML